MKLALGPLLSQLNIKQNKLAEMADTTPGYISQLVSGKKEPSQKMLRQIAEALGVDIRDLFAQERGFSADVPPAPMGFSESDADFVSKPNSLNSEGFSYLLAKLSIPTLGIFPGDILHMDLKESRQRGIAAVTKVNTDTGEAVTLIRQIEGGAMLPVIPGTPMESMTEPGIDIAILGWVTRIQRDISP